MAKGKDNPAYSHGHTTGGFSPTYHSWVGMIQRCTNPKRGSYKHYGGRGITVCKRWQKFENFLADMGIRPLERTLDRKNTNGNYTPSNCRWATPEEQARNSRQSIPITLGGETKTLPYWCEHFGISINTVRSRMKKQKWSVEDALMVPTQSTPFKKEKR